jgi:hypothetical protein
MNDDRHSKKIKSSKDDIRQVHRKDQIDQSTPPKKKKPIEMNKTSSSKSSSPSQTNKVRTSRSKMSIGTEAVATAPVPAAGSSSDIHCNGIGKNRQTKTGTEHKRRTAKKGRPLSRSKKAPTPVSSSTDGTTVTPSVELPSPDVSTSADATATASTCTPSQDHSAAEVYGCYNLSGLTVILPLALPSLSAGYDVPSSTVQEDNQDLSSVDHVDPNDDSGEDSYDEIESLDLDTIFEDSPGRYLPLQTKPKTSICHNGIIQNGSNADSCSSGKWKDSVVDMTHPGSMKETHPHIGTSITGHCRSLQQAHGLVDTDLDDLDWSEYSTPVKDSVRMALRASNEILFMSPIVFDSGWRTQRQIMQDTPQGFEHGYVSSNFDETPPKCDIPKDPPSIMRSSFTLQGQNLFRRVSDVNDTGGRFLASDNSPNTGIASTSEATILRNTEGLDPNESRISGVSKKLFAGDNTIPACVSDIKDYTATDSCMEIISRSQPVASIDQDPIIDKSFQTPDKAGKAERCVMEETFWSPNHYAWYQSAFDSHNDGLLMSGSRDMSRRDGNIHSQASLHHQPVMHPFKSNPYNDSERTHPFHPTARPLQEKDPFMTAFFPPTQH